jgi:acyl-CoA synthetase (AMP-forming)/AMP-acid ligase II
VPPPRALDDLSLWELVAWRAGCTPDGVFAVDERGRRLTFAEYRDECERVAAGFHEHGVREGEPVAWMLPTRLDAFVVAGALARLGAVQVPLIPILRQREVGFVLRQTGARLLVVAGSRRPGDDVAMAAAATGGLDHDVVVLDDVPRGDPARLPAAPPAGGAGAVRWIFSTSGTTSHPKGCRHTDATVAAAARRLNDRFAMTADDVNGLVFPVTHIGGISWLMGGLMAGYRHVLVEAFDPDASSAVLAREGVTIAGAGPAFWMAFVTAQRRAGPDPLFPALRALVGGGAPKPSTIHDEVQEVLGVVLATGYGSTECPGLAHAGVHDPDDVRRGDGHALDDVEIRVVAPDGGPVAPGAVGELLVRGPMSFLGYLDPADDAGAFDADGFFRTGDLGACDPATGVLRIVGRLKDIVIRKGENISAKEVEDVLYLHPGVAEVAVVALPDTERGELCCAVVVPEPAGGPLTLAGLAEHCRAQGLARQKAPERLELVEALPRNPTGKVRKDVLQRRYSP